MGKHIDPTQTPNRWITSPQLRNYLYHVATAGLALLTGAGVVEAVNGELWLGLIGAVLGLAGGAATELAAANTPTEN